MYEFYTKMTLRWLLAFSAVTLLCAGPVWADPDSSIDLRGTKIDFNIKKGKIAEIINKVSQHTDYVFIYEDDIEKELSKIVKIGKCENLYELLSEISKQSELEFRAVNQNIVIRKKVTKAYEAIKPHQVFRVSGRVKHITMQVYKIHWPPGVLAINLQLIFLKKG